MSQQSESSLKYKVQVPNYGRHLINGFTEFLHQEIMTDCVIVAEQRLLRAHKLILSASSNYFFNHFKDAPTNSENVAMCFVDMKFADLCTVIKFIYTGYLELDSKDYIRFYDAGKLLDLKLFPEIDLEVLERQRAQKAAQTPKKVAQPENKKERLPSTSKSVDFPSTSKKVVKQRKVAKKSNIDIQCQFCENVYHNKNTVKNHERFCKFNPNGKISTCPICHEEVKPGSMTFHKKHVHGYVPRSRSMSLPGSSASVRTDQDVQMANEAWS